MALIVALFALGISISSDSASAEAVPKIIEGHVYDHAGVPLSGAGVVVKMKIGATVHGTLSTSTNPAGFYTVSFDGPQWMIGDTIEVTATYGVDQKINDALTADDSDAQVVDVYFDFEIPEFGSVAGVLVAATAIGLAACVFLGRRRK